MDAKTRRQAIFLGALLVVLAAVVWWNLAGSTPAGTPRQAARRQDPAARGGEVAPVPRVKLDALSADRPAPAETRRDPFRFDGGFVAAREPEPSGPIEPPEAASRAVDAPSVPAGPPPIPLRFIGVLRVPQGQRLVAVLSDGVGVYRGTEGDVIEGRYRIVRVNLESVELAYVDGRGHQVIRISAGS